MKILVIPDIHGSHHWEKARERKDEFDKIIFLGDYVDSWENKWPDQMENLEAIFTFASENPTKVVLLWGNHDTSYYLNEQCSGHQPAHAIDIAEFFRNHKKQLKVIHVEKNYIFSHAGVSSRWMKYCLINDISEINDRFIQNAYIFCWIGPNGYGDNLDEGPLWIRPRSLSQVPVNGYIQVVGHTEVRTGNLPLELKANNKNKIILIDGQDHSFLYELEI